MSDESLSDEKPRRPGLRLLKQFLIGIPVGAVFGFLVATSGGFDALDAWSGENLFGLLLAAMFLLTGLIVGAAALSPKLLRRMMAMRDPDEPLDENAVASARNSSLTLLLAGATMLIPIFGEELGWALSLRQAGMAAVLLLTAVSAWASWNVYRIGDELARAVVVSSSAAAYFIGASFVFVWACAAKLGLIPDIGSWVIMMVLTAVSLASSVTIQLRRGMVPA